MTDQENKYLRLRTGDASDLQLLWACREILDTCANTLERYIKASGHWEEYPEHQKWFADLTNDIMLTIEPEKAETFLVNLTRQQIRVVSKSHIQTEPGYTLIQSEVLSNIITQAMTDTCCLCDGEGPDMARCRFRKSLKKTMMFAVDESGGVCMGRVLHKKLMEMTDE